MRSWMLLIPVGTSLECQRIPENEGAVLKDAAHRGRIDELDGFALGFFFAFVDFLGGSLF